MGVSNAWGKTVNGPRIYFDNSSMNMTSTQVYFVVGHSSFSRTYGPMTEISDTKLLYRDISKETYYNWGDATYVGFIQVGSKWGDGSWGSSNLKNATNYTAANTSWNSFDWQNTYYCKATSKGGAVSINYKSAGYSGIPKYNATQAAKLRNDITSSYATVNGTWPTTLKLQGTYLSGDGASARSEISGTASSNAESNRVYGAVVTGKITHTYNTITGNYIFEGWGTGDTPSTTNASYEYNITANTTVYAFFTKAYTVTYGKKGESGSSTVLATATANSTTKNISSGTKVAAGSTIKLTATPASGYRVVGWYSDANCTNQLQNGGNTYNAGTLTAAKTVYVKFEETKYDVTIQAGANGSVSPSGKQKVGNATSVTIEATANDGYKFKNWTLTGNVTIADANSATTTIKATGTGTVTANFETANRIYLKPAGDNDWAKDVTPRYAVYVIDDQTWHNMTKINDGDSDAGNDIYYCDIKSTYQKVIFCRMDPNAAANNWANRWTQTEDLTLPDNCNLFDIAKDASTANNVNATGTWMEYNAWHLAGAFNEWALCGQTFKEQEDGSFTFTQHLELGTYEFKLVHNGDWYGNNGTMVRGTSTGWTMSTSEDNCKITADYTGDYTFTYDATTKKLTVRYPILITLGSSMFGPYGISYNGQSYFSHKDKDVIINVPYGATINFIEGQPYSDIYTGDIMEKGKVRQFDLTQPYTIERDIRFDANYVTKVPQVAYLGVPNNNCDWDKNASYANFIWRFDSYYSFPMTNSNDKAEYAFEEDGVKYYKFTIPAGCNKFQIQRKQARNDDNNNQNQTHSHTCDHEYMILNAGVNCYMLNEGTFNSNTHTGYWCALPARTGDYRLLYVEQVVEKDANNNTVVTRKKAHPSDVVRASELDAEGTIVSLHVYKDRKYQANLGGGGTYESSSNPEIILQKYKGNDQWVDEECHMVFGPLETLPSMGMLPGRKNASVGSDKDDFVYDNGIEIIKNDSHEDQGSGVWNFYIVKNGSTVTLDLNRTHRYTGDYYIRTNAAFGEWNSYKGSDNHMTRSDVSKHHSNYSHYYCKWVESVGTNVKFTVANDYGMAISDTLVADSTTLWGELLADAEKMVTGETLPASANIRFAWNEKTNFLHRAYLAGSGEVGNRFLVLEGKAGELFNTEGNALTATAYDKENPRSNLNDNEEIFNDVSNWVYYTDVQMIPQAELKLTAKYNNKVQYFAGTKTAYCDTVLMGTGSDKYLIRILYDFKTNELISAYVPGGNSTIEPIRTNLMLIRKENNPASQLTFTTNNNKMDEIGKRAYGVLELTQSTLEDNSKNVYVRSLYWISFPFDVRITDIFGFGEYGKHWIIQSYDGAKRAREGLWLESETNWVYHFDPTTLNAGTQDQGIMKRGVGYVVALNLNNIKADELFVGRINTLALYFPSTTTITNDIVNTDQVIIDVPAHVCTINRNTPKGDRRIKDSHWNVIGVPSYINAVGNFGSINGKFDHIEEVNKRPEQLQFYYEWLGDYDQYKVATPSSTENFNSLTAYMVQYAGDLTWSIVLNEGPASLAAKRNSDEMEQYHLCLELQQNGQEQDRTFLQLQEDEVTAGFDFNYDLSKINNSGANIYSLIATDRDPIEVAGNVLPVEEAIIPLGIKTDAAGEYTFAMPEGTDGITVELIDYETNTRTNMLLDEYTVNLGKGTFETRFALHVKPDKTVTGLEEVNTNTNGVKKYLINGILYMQKDGALYDAQGKLVR
jgi:hypothetical protein